MKKRNQTVWCAFLAIGVVATSSAFAAEVETADPNPYRRGPAAGRSYYPPPPRYYDPPPRYIPAPPPRVRLGDICLIEDSRSGRTCDLRRPQPINSYCECVSPSGRVREGRVR